MSRRRQRELPKKLEESVAGVLKKKKCADLSPYHDVFNEVPYEKDLWYFAETMGDWFPLLPSLGIFFQEGKDIEESAAYRTPLDKRMAVLMLFSRKQGDGATYNKLMLAFFSESRMDLVRRVVEKAAERWQQERVEEEASVSYYDDTPREEERTVKRTAASHGSVRSKGRSSVLAAVHGELTVNSVVKVLIKGEFSAADCEKLGLNLQIKRYVLRNIHSNRKGEDMELQLYDIIDHWLNNDEEASWDKLADALGSSGYKVLASKIRGVNLEEEKPSSQDDDVPVGTNIVKGNVKEVKKSGALERSTIRKRPTGTGDESTTSENTRTGDESTTSENTQREVNRTSQKEEDSKYNSKYVIATVVIIIFVAGSVAWIFLPGHPQVLNSHPTDSVHPVGSGHKISDKRDLFRALADVGNWDSLCVNLGVADSAMDALRYNSKDGKLNKQECLTHYFNNNNADWGEVVKVVARDPISNRKLACEIAEKYMNMCRKTCNSFIDS